MAYGVRTTGPNFGENLRNMSKDFGSMLPELTKHYKEYLTNKNYEQDVKSQSLDLLSRLESSDALKNKLVESGAFKSVDDYDTFIKEKQDQIKNSRGKDNVGRTAADVFTELTLAGKGTLGDDWLARVATLGTRTGMFDKYDKGKQLIDDNTKVAEDVKEEKEAASKALLDKNAHAKALAFANSLREKIKNNQFDTMPGDLETKAAEQGIDGKAFKNLYSGLLTEYKQAYENYNKDKEEQEYVWKVKSYVNNINDITDYKKIEPYDIYAQARKDDKIDEPHAKRILDAAKYRKEYLKSLADAKARNKLTEQNALDKVMKNAGNTKEQAIEYASRQLQAKKQALTDIRTKISSLEEINKLSKEQKDRLKEYQNQEKIAENNVSSIRTAVNKLQAMDPKEFIGVNSYGAKNISERSINTTSKISELKRLKEIKKGFAGSLAKAKRIAAQYGYDVSTDSDGNMVFTDKDTKESFNQNDINKKIEKLSYIPSSNTSNNTPAPTSTPTTTTNDTTASDTTTSNTTASDTTQQQAIPEITPEVEQQIIDSLDMNSYM